ncbi:MAG: serine hydrolase domain-containing protein [Crocinitomicaceae bacterium]
MKKNTLAILLALFAFQGFGQNYEDTLDLKLEKFGNYESLPGFAVAIVNSEGVIYKNAYGYSDLENKKLYSQKTVQCVASVSKTMLAYAVMKLEEEGTLSLESPINDFLPYNVYNPLFKDSIIRIKHLVSHTSGIIDTDNNYDSRSLYFTSNTNLDDSRMEKDDLDWFKLQKANKNITIKEYCENVFSENGKWYDQGTFEKFSSGNHYSYTNLGAVLMAHIIEQASGVSYNDFIEENILSVLKMDKTTLDGTKVASNLLAKAYVSEKFIPTPILGSNTYPDGGVHTNCEDLSNYLIEMIKGYNGKSSLLSEVTFRKMMTPLLSEKVANSGETGKNFDNIGVFWHIAPNGNIWHNGGNPMGGTVYMWFDPATGIGRILITNCDVRGSREMVREFLSIWYTMEKYASKVK